MADLLGQPGVDLREEGSRKAVAEAVAAAQGRRQADARQRAAGLGLPLRVQRANGALQEIADFQGDEPIYRTTYNVNAAISTGANLVRSTYAVDGSGVVIGLWDGGSARVSHQEFGGRVVSKDGATSIDHATHVAGTLGASGVVANAKGMAPAVSIDSYDWNSDSSEMISRGASAAGQAGKIYLSNHSYGYIAGWNYVNNGTRVWEWGGDGTNAAAIEQDFGRYNSYTRDQDSLAFNAPYYLIFRSAGNDRVDSPAQGESVSLSSGGSSVVAYDAALHPPGDGSYHGGFETISFEALAKNVMTVGSVTDAVTGGIRDVTKANQSSFSSWGPTDDGRIKPDVVANGDGLYSSLNGSNSAYGTYSGTSMASPNATGSAALLIQHYGAEFPGQAMRASTLKGLLIHTADDRGNPGPDYKFGWGLVNAKAAADLITDHHDNPLKQRITESSLSTSVVTRSVPIIWDGTSPIVATLCWTDPAGPATSTSDLRVARLVNNLNLKITGPSGSEHLPYVMPFVGTWTQASMDSAATTGINNTDNVEQVRISAPPQAGTYQVIVSFSGTLTNSSQNYSLLISGAAAQEPPPLPLALSAVTPTSGLSGNMNIDVSGTGLRSDSTLKLTRAGQSDILASGIQLSGGVLRGLVNLTGATPGLWNVVVMNPGGETATLANAFTVIGALWSEGFDGTVSDWASQATTGSNAWVLSTAKSHSPSTSYFAPAPDSKSTVSLTSPQVNLPSNASNLQLRFWQSYNLQQGQDGGKLEFSVDNGPWFDVTASGSGASFASNGYNATISATGPQAGRSDFAGQSAWSGNSNGFIETVVNLTDTAKYAGHSLRMRWRLATNGSTASAGWNVDSMALIGGGDFVNQAPAITTAANAATAETVTDLDGTIFRIVRGAAVGLSVAATDDGGEAALTYTWSLASGPAAVGYSINGTNAAKLTDAAFQASGDYRFSVQVVDAAGLATSSSVNVRVLQTASELAVTPASAVVMVGNTRSFTATLRDQFGIAMNSSGTAWAASGGGSINGSGVFTASTAGGPFVVTGSASGFSGNASVTVTPAPATLSLGNLEQTYDGTPRPVSCTTTPGGLAVSITYNGSSSPPVNAGTYTVEADITNPNYQGSTSGVLHVAKASATVILGSIVQTYDGTPRPVSCTTIPSGLAVGITYIGSASPPVNAGDYPVEASIVDSNYQGSASAVLHVAKAEATIALGDLAQTYDGTPRVVSCTTTPASLAVSVSYNGSASPPLNAGTYAVVANITDSNYQGAANAELEVAKALATISVGDLSQTYDGTPHEVTSTTTPEGLVVDITYDGAETAPVNAGTYAVVATFDDPNYQGSDSEVLQVAKANAAISLGNLSQTYDGSPKAVSVTTTPAGLATIVSYGGEGAAPSSIGRYPVLASIEDPNYTGEASGQLEIIGMSYQTWQSQHFSEEQVLAGLAAADRDPDGDRLDNLAEYALGSDPFAYTAGPAMELDEAHLALVFVRPKGLGDVSYTAQSGSDLAGWTEVPLEVIEETATTETVRARVARPAEARDLFMRIRFESP